LTKLWWLSTPNAISSACIAFGFTRPLKRDIIAITAFPGMRRGMRKFNVTAAHSVTTKNPSRRRTNLIDRAPCASPGIAALLLGREHQARGRTRPQPRLVALARARVVPGAA